MAPSGRIVLLNGAPRAGKSSIARALQARGDWLNLGVDASMAATPPHLLPGIGLRPGGERPELEPFIAKSYAALFATLAAHARQNLDIVADLGLHDAYSRPLGLLEMAAQTLSGLDVLFVGVRCPLEIIMARRNADPQDGFYAAGPGIPAPVQRWQDEVHRPGRYDLELDTAAHAPETCATLILKALENPPTPSVLFSLA